jgi:O-antigen biosynthesis protein
MRICFLIGSVDISGGTYVIFQHAAYLQAAGHQIVLATQNLLKTETSAWHPDAKNLNILTFTQAQQEDFDIVIATWWKTALELQHFKAKHYAYFVQSIESRFYPDNQIELRKLVDATYALPVAFVTEASWIKEYLAKHHHQQAALVRNGVRKELYTYSGKKFLPPRNGLRILVEGPLGVAFKNTGRALKVARKANVGEVWLLTSTTVGKLPYVERVFSRVAVNELPKIYRSCDVILKLSTVEGMFGPPLEMFHCGGTAITYDVTGHDEYIVHNTNALVAARGDENAVLSFLHRLRDEPQTLLRLKQGAVKTANMWPGWEESSSTFEGWLKTLSLPADVRTITTLNKIAWERYIKNSRPDIISRSKDHIFQTIKHAVNNNLPLPLKQSLQTLRYFREVV